MYEVWGLHPLGKQRDPCGIASNKRAINHVFSPSMPLLNPCQQGSLLAGRYK